MRRLFAAIILITTMGMLAACYDDHNRTRQLGLLELFYAANSPKTGANIILSSSSSWHIYPNQALSITASLLNDSTNAGVAWSLTGNGSLSGETPNAVIYTAPSSTSVNETAIITAVSNANPADTATLQITIIPNTGDNVQPVEVNGGPLSGQTYPNAAFTSVKICVPGSAVDCQTIDGILIDTGSTGLRILASQIAIGLATETGTTGGAVNNCIKFADGSFLWGPVAPADVTMANETAQSSTPIQMIKNPTDFPIPISCSQGGVNQDTLSALGANGILGVGTQPQDCGSICTGSTSPGAYYQPAATGYEPTTVPLSGQVTNPILNFTTDNNGAVIELASISDKAASIPGSMIFGIGTRTNNALGSGATLLNNLFTTDFNGQSLTSSFIDSGSNGLFFNDSSIPVCTVNTPWYCPSNTLNLAAVNHGTSQSAVNFSVDNADALFQNINFAAFVNLAGTGFPGSFDWGLPFFYGRAVFTAIGGQSTPAGNGPFVAY